MGSETEPSIVADARNTLCPGPFWELIKAYNSADRNEVISLYSTEEYDSDTKKDAPVWVSKTGNQLIGIFDREGFYEIRIRKTRGPHPS